MVRLDNISPYTDDVMCNPISNLSVGRRAYLYKIYGTSNQASYHHIIYTHLPITTLRQKRRKLLQPLLILLVESSRLRTINVDDRNRLPRISNTTQHSFHQRKQTHLPANKNRHHNLTPTTRVTGNMSRETQHIRHNHRLALLRCGATHAAPEADLLASRAALEWA